jgi:hypothetical protein
MGGVEKKTPIGTAHTAINRWGLPKLNGVNPMLIPLFYHRKPDANKKMEPVTPPMFLEKPSWSSEDFWVLSICYNQNFAILSFVAAPSISQVLTRPSVDELPAIQAVQKGLVVLCVLFTA